MHYSQSHSYYTKNSLIPLNTQRREKDIKRMNTRMHNTLGQGYHIIAILFQL